MAKGLSVKKSKSFEANLDSRRYVSAISQNVTDVTFGASANANMIAPIDTGKLRQSMRVQFENKNGQHTGIVTWEVFARVPKRPYNYALTRFFVNKKNPQTTRWTERDYAKNGEKYSKILKRGVIKK